MARSIWKGSISFGLANIPVSLTAAESRPDIQLHMVDSKNHARIRYERVNADTGAEVPWDRLVKGYEHEDGQFILLSEDEAAKRLAVHVEDHPLDYGSFEGTIPKGNYGAGSVAIWDHGTWEPLARNWRRGFDQGKLTFRLHGERLRGTYLLVRMKEEPNWLLGKLDDAIAADRTPPPPVQSLACVRGRRPLPPSLCQRA